MTSLQVRAGRWHRARFPAATAPWVALRAISELGEVAEALCARQSPTVTNGHPGDVAAEAADVVIALLVLVGRWHPGRDLLADVAAKLDVLEDPESGHRSAALPASSSTNQKEG